MKMKIVLAPDSFKGSLTSIQVAEVMSAAIKSVNPTIETVLKPMADGGEGTLTALLMSTPGEKTYFHCKNVFGEASESWYVTLPDKTAIIECANIAGLQHIPEDQRNPNQSTSFGIGQAILHAVGQGCKKIIVALGGSATNDAGYGMLQALGMKAWNKSGEEIGFLGKDLLDRHPSN